MTKATKFPIKWSTYVGSLRNVVQGFHFRISDLKPSEWTEKNRYLTPDVSRRSGPFRYDHTPYLREVVDCLSPYHPARRIAVKKGAQIGFSTGVIESGIGWIISQSPGNILFMTGSPDLTEIAMNKKIDQMIDSCGLRKSMRSSAKKKKNNRTGDTAKGKEFSGGSLMAGNASNHKLLRQVSMKYGFIDDLDSIKHDSKQSGNTLDLIDARFVTYADIMKLFLISTPERTETSNIDGAFLKGDQRYYNIPCPCCGAYIVLKWSVEITGSKEMGGITWELNEKGNLDETTVRYVCQECGKSFDEAKKHAVLIKGYWKATAEPSEPGYYSYHISSLYSAPGSKGWVDWVRQYLAANPPWGRIEDKHQTFLNTVLGESYQLSAKAPEASEVQSKQRQYVPGIVPEWQSVKDGNGRVMFLTCACDLNGKEDDARLDYEVVAWTESGASYSVVHGSIGSFIPRETEVNRTDRVKMSYNHNRQNSVWPILEKEVLNKVWASDVGRDFMISITGVDCGHYTIQAYDFIDNTNCPLVYGVKGDKEEKYRKYKMDLPLFKSAREREKLFLLDVNYIKDLVADKISLHWNSESNEKQPPGFMNYPQSHDGLYSYRGFFKHYEAEHRVDDIKGGIISGTRWVKKNQNDQNHFWDVYVYNFALKEIFAAHVLKESEYKKGTWSDFVAYMLGN